MSDTSKSYDLENGNYTFWVRAKDEANNENQAPLNHTFVVNAAPKVASTERISRSVWASRITLEMPSGASHPTDAFVLMPEHSGISDSELVPIRIHPVDDPNACGANAIVAAELGIMERITTTATGYIVSLPDSIPLGQTVQYDIVWGKVKYFGWQEFVDVPIGFPNGAEVKSSYLDEDFRLWRLATKLLHKGGSAYNKDAWVFMNVSNESGNIVEETELRYAYGHDWDGSTKEYTRFDYGYIHRIEDNICFLWNDRMNIYNGSENLNPERYGSCFFDYSCSLLSTDDSTYSEDTYVNMSNTPIANTMWLTGRTGEWSGSPLPKNAWFEVFDSYGDNIVPRTVYYTIQHTNGSYFSHYQACPIGCDTLLLFSPVWYGAPDYENEREQICYQIRDDSGQIVRDTTVLSPPLIPDSEEKDDTYTVQSVLTDDSGKVWISYRHWQRETGNEPMYYYYVIIDSDGDIWKGPIETPESRSFVYCDMDGYIWAKEAGQLLVLNDDDTQAASPRPAIYMPTQYVGDLSATVSNYGYRLYDRWSPKLIVIDLPPGVNADSMELFDLNLWDNDLHTVDPNLMKGDNPAWSHSGQFTGHTTVDTKGVFDEGINILTMTQNDFLGGQVLITFSMCSGIGDFNNDCNIDLKDLILLTTFWLENEPMIDIAPPPKGDNIVNMFDYNLFAEYWNKN